MPPSNGHALRRSSRVPIQVPIHVTSLEPNSRFSEVCETLVVSAHGCALHLPVPLNAGSALHLHTKEGRQATAYVVGCQPIGSNGSGWRLGARLDHPDNVWGLDACPADWRVLEMPAPTAEARAEKSNGRKPQPQAMSAQAILDKVEEHLSEERLRPILARLVRPLQAEVTELTEKLARHSRQNRFEVSLGHIPPELEAKLWERLRQELGAQVLEQTRQQSAELLSSAKTATDEKIGAALVEFRHRLSGELHAIEQKAQALAKELTTSTQQQAQAGLDKLQEYALDAGAQLSAQGAKLSASLEQRLVEMQNVHRREIELLHTAAAARAAKLESEVADLNRRIGTLNEAVRHLESDLDAHLERVAGEIVSNSRTQLEEGVVVALKDFQTRSSNEVDTRVDEVCGHLRAIQNRIEHSFSGSLETQGDETLQSVARQFEELTERSVERWRASLARNLNSVAKTLGSQIQQEFQSEAEETR